MQSKNVYDELMEKYPKIFGEDFCIECPEGWCRLIGDLCESLQYYADTKQMPQLVAEQVKFKWGTMRFYYRLEGEVNDFDSGFISGMVRVYEKLTKMICSQCGSNVDVSHCHGNYLCGVCRKK